jgi:hypothetical protein
VADERGRVPRESREAFLGEFTAQIGAEARSLSEELPALRAALQATRAAPQPATSCATAPPGWPPWRRSRRSPPPACAQSAPETAPRLLAVITTRSPVEDVVARLAQVQAEHPEARVRRGKEDSWEIWAAPADD